MLHDGVPLLTLTGTHAVVKYPRQRDKHIAEVLGRVPGENGEPERVYLRTRVHTSDAELFVDVDGGRWFATGAISTVLAAEGN